jgi:hypothetical protein
MSREGRTPGERSQSGASALLCRKGLDFVEKFSLFWRRKRANDRLWRRKAGARHPSNTKKPAPTVSREGRLLKELQGQPRLTKQ